MHWVEDAIASQEVLFTFTKLHRETKISFTKLREIAQSSFTELHLNCGKGEENVDNEAKM